MKNNSKNNISISIFIACTAPITLWGSGEKSTSQGFYPYQTTTTVLRSSQGTDLFMPEEYKEKSCLLHETYIDPKTKTSLPGFISPIASPNPSPQVSPEKIKPKQKRLGARAPIAGIACDLFNIKAETRHEPSENELSVGSALNELEKIDKLHDNKVYSKKIKTIKSSMRTKFIEETDPIDIINPNDPWQNKEALLNLMKINSQALVLAQSLKSNTYCNEFTSFGEQLNRCFNNPYMGTSEIHGFKNPADLNKYLLNTRSILQKKIQKSTKKQ